jgi:hypothetical protein
MILPRRHFIQLAGTAAAAAFLAPSVSDAKPPQIPASAWKNLADKVRGGVLRPGDRGFAALTRPQNLRYDDITPLGVAASRRRRNFGGHRLGA